MSEQQLDVDPLSLRSLLLPHCTSIKFRVKHAASELLFQLCDEQRQHSTAQHSTAQHNGAPQRSRMQYDWSVCMALLLNSVQLLTARLTFVAGCVQRMSSFDCADWAMR